MKVYTRKGDDGTTGLFYGGRVRKDSPAPTAYGGVDEAQAHIGLARALAGGQLLVHGHTTTSAGLTLGLLALALCLSLVPRHRLQSRDPAGGHFH